MVLKCFDATPLFGLFPQNYEVFYLTNDTYSPANKDSFYIVKVEKKKKTKLAPLSIPVYLIYRFPYSVFVSYTKSNQLSLT